MAHVQPHPFHTLTVREIVYRAAEIEEPTPDYVLPEDMYMYEVTLDMLHEAAEGIAGKVEQAKEAGQSKEEIHALENDLEERRQQLDLALSVNVAIQTEVERLKGAVRYSPDTELELISAEDGSAHAEFTTHSAYRWLKKTFQIEIPEWAPPEARHSTDKPKGGVEESESGVWLPYSTPLIEMMLSLMQEHWVDYDPSNPPTNEAIKTAVRIERDDAEKNKRPTKYPADELSGTALDTILKMMRRP